MLIMDEVQSLFTPSPQYADSAGYLADQLVKDTYRESMMVFALTATPGNGTADVLKVLNFVRPLGMQPLVPADVQHHPEKFRGLVSYVDTRGDTSRYGIKTVRNVYVPMSERYYVGFLRTIGTLRSMDLHYCRAEKESKEFGFWPNKKRQGTVSPRRT